MKKAMSLVLCSLVLASVSSKEVLAVASSAATKGDITFTEGGGEGAVETEDPNPDPSPDKDPDPNPTEDGETGNGALKFTYLPNIHFGESELNAQKVSYYHAEFMAREYGDGPTVGNYPTFLTVQDVRGGAKGWKVTAHHNGTFVNKANKEDVLRGRIQLNNAHIETNTFTEPTDIDQYKPESKVTGLGNNYLSISNEANQEVEIMVAKLGTGYGKWSQGFGATNNVTSGKGANGTSDAGKINPTKANRNEAVRLEYPAQVAQTEQDKNHYEATITWGLSNTP